MWFSNAYKLGLKTSMFLLIVLSLLTTISEFGVTIFYQFFNL